jgi:hypothetical protein
VTKKVDIKFVLRFSCAALTNIKKISQASGGVEIVGIRIYRDVPDLPTNFIY